jgi:hypothetical protein
MKRLTDEELAAVRRTLSGAFGSAAAGLKKLLENYQADVERLAYLGASSPRKGEHGPQD